MKTGQKVLLSLASGIICLVISSVAQAGSQQVYLSSAGSDFNICSGSQPCRTFNKALAYCRFENTLGVAAESATVRLDHCVITRNTTGIVAASASILGTATGTNLIDANGTGNTVTGTVTLQ